MNELVGDDLRLYRLRAVAGREDEVALAQIQARIRGLEAKGLYARDGHRRR